MRPAVGFVVTLLLAGCAGAPVITPWTAEWLVPALPADCAASAAAGKEQAGAGSVPGGVAVVRSEERDVVLVAARGCLWAIDAASGSAAALPTRGDAIAPTMIDGTAFGLAFSSSLSGSVRVIDADGAITFNVSGLRRPVGVRLLAGGSALVAEQDAGRLLRVGPTQESRARLVADGLEEPGGLLVFDATRVYVTESAAGRVTRLRLDRDEKTVVASGLSRPEGIARMTDGRLAVVEAGKRRLVAVDLSTGERQVMVEGLPAPAESASTDPFAFTDVAAAPDGRLYVSSAHGAGILRVTLRGAEAR